MTSFACVAYDSNGVCYTGGANSQIYVWNGRDLSSTIKAHSAGFICALRFVEGKLYSGGKDGKMAVINTQSLQVEKTIDFGGVLIRAIDVMGQKALVGLRDGTIYEVEMGSGAKKAIMESHCDGEVWGLAPADDTHVVTSGDDNKIKTWNIASRKCEATGKISSESRKAPKGGASSLTTLPDSQCARAVAYNPKNGHIAVGHNDGGLSIRAGFNKLD
jgi:WD40 repeat protein